MSLYIIAIGGTGSKFVEALIHIGAAGLLNEETVYVLFVDPDESNGNLDRARNTLRVYRNCYQRLKGRQKGDSQECQWMKTPFEDFAPKDVWSPLGDRINRNLGSLFNYHNYQESDPLRNLFDALYTEKERELSLDMGFRGRPAIGAAVMSQLNTLADVPWNTFFDRVRADLGAGSQSPPKIFLCGSAFGGTGASGFPTLGRLIDNQLKDQRERVKLGGALLLPYFRYDVPPEYNTTDEDEQICARPEQFLLNTEAALRYYRQEAQRTFDRIYLLGNPAPVKVDKFSLGKGDQRNIPHFIELYAALAVRHFLSDTPKERGEAAVISRENPNRLTWSDFPAGVKPRLVQTTRFAVAWMTEMRLSFENAKQMSFNQFSKNAPWATEFFASPMNQKLPNFEQEHQLAGDIDRWCEDYLRWLGDLHNRSESIQVQLFNREAFLEDNDQLKRDASSFNKLVIDGSFPNEKDTVALLKNQLKAREIELPNQGMVGLARALYVRCGK